MNLLKQTIKQIMPLDEAAMRALKENLHLHLPRPNGLGYLEGILINYAGITGKAQLALPKKCTVVACADHGVAELKLSAYPIETTVHMTRNYLISKGAVANALSNFSGAEMVVIDMGIAAPMDQIPGLIDRKIAYGTKNCANGPAMTREQAVESIHTGIAIANEYAAKGFSCFLPGEMGIANTTSSAAIVATLCGLTPQKATGRGTNISDERLRVKIEVVKKALAVNQPDATDGIDVLAKIGGFELGCITGIILGAAANRSLVVLDGFNTGAAALIAATICPLAKNYLMGSHLAAEPAHQRTLEVLGIRPYMDMKFRLGEATGSSIAVNLLDAMILAYTEITAVNEISIPIKKTPVKTSAFQEKDLEDHILRVQPLQNQVMEACQLYIDNLTKPIHSLGVLEQLAVKIAGITAVPKPGHLKKSMLLFAHDYAASTANSKLTHAFSAHAKADLHLIKVGNANQRSRQQVLAAMKLGINAATEEIQGGKKIIGLATYGAKTKAAAVHLLRAYDKEQSALFVINQLEQVGTPEIAALIGAIIATAELHGVIVLDDFATQVAALYAIHLAPAVKNYLINTESSPLKQHQALLPLLDLPSYLNLDMCIGEGCTSALGIKLIDAALHMLNDMKTFGQAAVAVANDGPGADRQNLTI